MGEAIISRRGGGKLFAVIDVSYPAGAVCTCSNGTRTLRARGTGGHFLFNIPTAGDWTVTAVLGEDTATETINVTERTAYSVELSFNFLIFDRSTQSYDSIAAIITNDGEPYSGIRDKAPYIEFWASGATSRTFQIGSKMDITPYKKLVYVGYAGGYGPWEVGLTQADKYGDVLPYVAVTESVETRELDITDVNGMYYIAVGMGLGSQCYIEKIYLIPKSR